MLKKTQIFIIMGIIFILVGVGLFVIYSISYSPEKKASKLLREASVLINIGDRESYEKAKEKLVYIIANFPESMYTNKAYFLLGDIYEKFGYYKQAYKAYKDLYRRIRKSKNPIDKDILIKLRIRLATLKGLSVYPEEGIDELKAILAGTDSPTLRGEIYFNIGRIYLKNGEYKKALKNFKIALRENPSLDKARDYITRIYEISGRYSRAFDEYKETIEESFPKKYGLDLSILKRKALSYGIKLKRKAPYEAIRFLKYVYRKFPDTPEAERALMEIGDILLSLKKPNKALYYYKKVLDNSIKKLDDKALFKIATIYMELEDYDLALKNLNKLIIEYPESKYTSLARRYKTKILREIELKHNIENETEPEETI